VNKSIFNNFKQIDTDHVTISEGRLREQNAA